MRLIFLFLSLFLVINPLSAQTIEGRVMNDNDASPLSDVVVQNLNNSAFHTLSDTIGHYEIIAATGDSIRFTLLGFRPRIVVYNGENSGWFSWIGMKQQSFVIDTVVIHKELTQYQIDSLENRKIYGRKVNERPAKFRLSRSGGKGMVTFDAPLSAPMQRISKKYKQLKKFQERYKMDEAQLFIDSRYIPDSVTVLTGLQNDSLFQFMKAYPMSYSFARTASELEIKMWIKHNYKEWIKNPVTIPSIIYIPDSEAGSLKKP